MIYFRKSCFGALEILKPFYKKYFCFILGNEGLSSIKQSKQEESDFYMI